MLRQDAGVLHAELVQYGFYVPLSVFPSGSIPDLANLFASGDPTLVKGFLAERLREELGKEHIFSLRKRWDRNRFFSKRKHILDAGLDAHLKGDFVSSIPVLLPHLEGIVFEFLYESQVFKKKSLKRNGVDALSMMKKVLVQEDLVFTRWDKKQFQEFVTDKGIYDNKEDKDIFLNRGAILHGECLNYNNEEWSAQLIYFLDFLNVLTSHKWDRVTLPDRSETIQLRKTVDRE